MNNLDEVTLHYKESGYYILDNSFWWNEKKKKKITKINFKKNPEIHSPIRLLNIFILLLHPRLPFYYFSVTKLLLHVNLLRYFFSLLICYQPVFYHNFRQDILMHLVTSLALNTLFILLSFFGRFNSIPNGKII